MAWILEAPKRIRSPGNPGNPGNLATWQPNNQPTQQLSTKSR